MNERRFILAAKKASASRVPGLEFGIGDDCAVLRHTRKFDLIITSDSLVENTHFSRRYFAAEEIGYRAMACNVSDICAMGGLPKYALVCAGFPKRESLGYCAAVFRGIVKCCKKYGAVVIGGDTVASENIFLSITLAGTVEKGRALYRHTASAGDAVYVTGFLGGPRAGLKALMSKPRKKMNAYEYVCAMSHIRPVPRLREGRLLKSGLVTSCMDVSDGLANDIYNLAQASGTGALLFYEQLPVSVAVSEIAGNHGEKAADYALYGGEDFELLFTVPYAKRKSFEGYAIKNNIIATEIGLLTRNRKKLIRKEGRISEICLKKAWKHF